MQCGHQARAFDGAPLVCDRADGHEGYHEQRVQLRDGVSVTSWGDDGKATWATSVVRGHDGLPRRVNKHGPIHLGGTR